MSWADIAKTCRNKYNLLIEEPESLPTQFDNVEFIKPDPQDRSVKWARLQILEGDTRQATLGSGTANRYRTPGIMLVSLFVPAGVGDGKQRELADVISSKFRSVTYDGVVFHTPRINPIGRDGEWYQVNVTCPFHADD